MKYSQQLADHLIAKHQLGRTVRYRWKRADFIPDEYFDEEFVKSESLTEDQRTLQESLLGIIEHPIIFHSAFGGNLRFKGKLDEMLFLRRSKNMPGRQRKNRPSIPDLNFSPDELIKITSQMRELMQVMRSTLAAATKQPYPRKQESLKELLRSRPELTTRQTVAGINNPYRTRWINFVAGVRGALPESDQYVVDHVYSELENISSRIQAALYYLPTQTTNDLPT